MSIKRVNRTHFDTMLTLMITSLFELIFPSRQDEILQLYDNFLTGLQRACGKPGTVRISHQTTRHQLPHKDHITIHTLLPVRWNWSQPNSLDTHTHTHNHPLSFQPLTLSTFNSESSLDFRICDKLRGNMSLWGNFEIVVILESIQEADSIVIYATFTHLV